MDQNFSRQTMHEETAETRMGSGKGNPEYWVAVVKPGRVMFEMGWSSSERRASRFGTGSSKVADQMSNR